LDKIKAKHSGKYLLQREIDIGSKTLWFTSAFSTKQRLIDWLRTEYTCMNFGTFVYLSKRDPYVVRVRAVKLGLFEWVIIVGLSKFELMVLNFISP